MVGAPPVVMFTTTLERCLITLRNGAKASGDLIGPAVLRIARMQMDDGRARLGRADRGIGDLLRRSPADAATSTAYGSSR